jgi:hypothetical protein
MTAEREQAFWHIQYDGFSPTGPEDDMLHPEQNAEREGDTLTETQYFGFGVPSERIHALCYMWHHPNLHVVFGGLFVWQGVKRNNFECEIFDFVTYQSDACLANDLWEYKLDNGYHVTTLEPMLRHRVRYEDGRRRNLVDVEFEAMMPAVRMKNAMHFEQGMKTKGRLVLGGREYEVDGYTVRDRSWGHLRSEEHKPYPPMAWMNCCYGDAVAFGATVYDSLDSDPEWNGAYADGTLELPPQGNCMGGWIWRDGALVQVASAYKKTERDADTLYPTSCEMRLTDTNGLAHAMRAEMSSAANWRTWQNFDAVYGTTRWEYDGMSSYGDYQEAQWWDYERLFLGRGAVAVGR